MLHSSHIKHKLRGKNARRKRLHSIPLTTKHKDTPFYHQFKMKEAEKYSSAILSQIRAFDTARIRDHHPLGSVDGATLREIKDALIAMVG